MIKSDEHSGAEGAGSRIPICWNREANCLALRVELQDGTAFVFPYIHLSHARLKPAEDGDELLIVFSSHQVTARGRHLAKILTSLQRNAVDWIRPLPTSTQLLAEDGAAWINSIDIEESGGNVSHRVDP